ncbi:MAG: hypothetical protein FGM24_06195 [Candidatus Kapabacteria bacterium]|nr:hypothetical protein [Candidatus Kapabacteria bacterium]
MNVVVIGAIAYACSIVIGIIAWRRSVHLGRWHHAAYATACAGTLLALVVDFHAALLLPALSLSVLPFWSGRTRIHRVIGLAGSSGYLYVFLT